MPRPADLIPSDDELRASGVGQGDFEQIGQEFLAHLTTLASLGAADEVLEIGCGIGRIAIPLTGLVRPPGRYEGVDVIPASISWCSNRITPLFPHFNFQLSDVANTFYNPAGRIPGDRFRFPFPDSSFDIVIAVSLFTHLLPDAAGRYLREAQRVLRPGGRVFASFFLWSDDAERSQAATDMFPHDGLTHRVATNDNPEAAVALQTRMVLDMFERAGLHISRQVHGTWAAAEYQPPYQDLIVAIKQEA